MHVDFSSSRSMCIRGVAMWKKCVLSLLTGMLILSLLAGCGNGTQELPTKETYAPQEEGVSEAGIQEAVPTEAPKEPYDLMTQEWKPQGKLTNSGNWWKVADYVEHVVFPQEGEESIWYHSASDGVDFYIMVPFYTYENEDSQNGEIVSCDYYINRLNTETMEITCVKPDAGEYLTENTWVEGLAVSGGQMMLFLQQYEGEEKETVHYYAVSLNQDGTCGEAVDLLPVLEQCGLKPENNLGYSGVDWDCQGYFYMTSGAGEAVYVADAAGNLLESWETSKGQTILSKCKSPEGILIWEKEEYEADSITYFYYGPEGMQVLYEGTYDFVTKRAMNSYGELIFIFQSALVRWNASNGTYERIYFGTGMDSNNYVAMLQNSKGEVILITDEGSNVSATVYSLSGPAQTTELTLWVQGVYDYTTQSYINEFVRKHPGVTVKVQEVDFNNKDAEWTRLLADLSAGKGPDLFLIDRPEMLILQEKGVLADLSEVLGKELESNIFPGVLDNGRVDGKLYGMTYNANYWTLMVSEDAWNKETWTIEDAIQVMEGQAQKGMPLEAFQAQWTQDGGQTPMGIFVNLTFDLENSSFLDLEKGECYFDTKEFCRLLEVCKKYGSENVQAMNFIDLDRKAEVRQYVQDGYALTYSGLHTTLPEFSEDMAYFEDNYHCVGYPTNGDCGSYWMCSHMLAVNVQAKGREIIDELLQYLYSKECQMNSLANSGIIVRRDLLANSVVEHVDWTDKPVQYLNNGHLPELETKPDGSTYLEEYLELLDSCVAKPAGAEDIEDILQEEIPAFFHDDKDAETVAEIVQRRVQLYLDEGK